MPESNQLAHSYKVALIISGVLIARRENHDNKVKARRKLHTFALLYRCPPGESFRSPPPAYSPS